MDRVCRICLQDIENTCEFYCLNKTQEIIFKLKSAVPQMSVHCLQDALICLKCVGELNTAYSFIQKCLQTETKVQNYMKEMAKDYSTVNLKKVAVKYGSCIKSEPKTDEDLSEGHVHESPAIENDFDENPYVLVQVYDNDDAGTEEDYTLDAKKKSTRKERVRAAKKVKQVEGEITQKLFECHICKKQYVTKDYLREHIRMHTGEKLFSCELCGKSFTFRSGLRDHVKTHTGFKRYRCDVCGIFFKRLFQLKLHTQKHTGMDLPHKCHSCKETFASIVEAEQHQRGMCNGKLYSCLVCLRKFNMKSHFKSHLRSHTGQSPHECRYCKCTFADRCVLLSHYRLEACDENFEDVSNECSSVASSSPMGTHTVDKIEAKSEEEHQVAYDEEIEEGQAVEHLLELPPMRSRSGKVKHKCSVCGSRFSNVARLEGHMRNHTGEKYQCDVCKKEFTERGTLTRHSRIHTGEKPYICTTCGKSFTYASVLSKHMQTHTGEKPFLCTGCGTTFRRQHHLKAHFTSFHTCEKHDHCVNDELSNENVKNEPADSVVLTDEICG